MRPTSLASTQSPITNCQSRTRLAIIIVSYNVRDLLHSCLGSVFQCAQENRDALAVDVLVVDNASEDGSAGMVADEFPDAHLIRPQENLGFTAANNLALNALGFTSQKTTSSGTASLQRPDYVLLLNPDTELVDNPLTQMVSFMQQTAEVGVCGAQLRYGDGSFQHGAFQFPGLAQIALDLYPLEQVPGLRRCLPRLLDSRINGRYPRAWWNGRRPFPVDFVLGAALMVRANTLQQVGLLDDGYFMYCEEMDWCLRVQQAGWQVCAVPTAHVIHHEGQSSKQVKWASFRRLWTSRLRFYYKHAQHFRPGFLLALRLILCTGIAFRTWSAKRRFARGVLTGEQVTDELDALARVRAAVRAKSTGRP